MDDTTKKDSMKATHKYDPNSVWKGECFECGLPESDPIHGAIIDAICERAAQELAEAYSVPVEIAMAALQRGAELEAERIKHGEGAGTPAGILASRD